MNVNLYNNKSLANVVDKVLSTATVVTGDAFVLPYEERFPKVRFTANVDWDNYNYMQIDGKFYYITSVEHVTNVECIVSGEMDLLMTYKDWIRDQRAYLKRSDNHDTPYVNDEMQVMQCNQNYTIFNFPSNYALSEDEKDGCYVLVTIQKYYADPLS